MSYSNCRALLRLSEVERLTSLSKSSIYRLEAAGKFPRRVRISERASGWYSDEIANYVESRPRASGVAGSVAA
jgi:prophage regulatory protein